MADTKTSALTTLATCDMSNDYIPILDVSGAELKRITPNDLLDSDVGTWTPVISEGVNDAVMLIAGRHATYEKHGRQVSIIAYLSAVALGSVSGAIRISGLPFVVNGHTSVDIGYGALLNITAGHSMGGYAVDTASFIALMVWDSVAGTTAMQASEFTSSGIIMLSATYNI